MDSSANKILVNGLRIIITTLIFSSLILSISYHLSNFFTIGGKQINYIRDFQEDINAPSVLNSHQDHRDFSSDKFPKTKFDPVLFYLPAEASNCQPKKVLYLKVHKTGSTLVTKVMAEHRKRHQFTNTLTGRGAGTGRIGGYPAPFSADLHKDDPKSDVLIYHSRYNWPEMRKVLVSTDDLVKIATIREPTDLLRSIYNYFYIYFHKKYGDKPHTSSSCTTSLRNFGLREIGRRFGDFGENLQINSFHVFLFLAILKLPNCRLSAIILPP